MQADQSNEQPIEQPNDRPKHVNPGLDCTINPIVIDDSYREKKKSHSMIPASPMQHGLSED